MSNPRNAGRRVFVRAVSSVAGVLAALVVAEGVLRLFVTPGLPPLPTVSADTSDGPAIVSRQIEEGIATATFSPAGARLTGATSLPGAPTVVIVGNSYVVAREVSDSNTMGAQLAQIARADGVRLNVRQYGWRGASPARYVQQAPAVLARWNPAAVIVPISDFDLDYRATEGPLPRFRIDSAGNPIVVSDPAGDVQIRAGRSVLVTLIERRWTQLLARAPRRFRRLPATPGALAPGRSDRAMPLKMIPDATVSALKAAYGERLVLLYIADVRASGGEHPDEFELRFLAACKADGVVCQSARSAMLERRKQGAIVRGFSTTTLGVGHLNDAGHRLIAQEAWEILRGRFARPGPA